MKRHSVTSLETARSLANDPNWEGGEGEVCILRSPGMVAFPISLLSIGGMGDMREGKHAPSIKYYDSVPRLK